MYTCIVKQQQKAEFKGKPTRRSGWRYKLGIEAIKDEAFQRSLMQEI